ncbi:nickel/cobalt efflux protein RcnA [Stenotrophobium rhamnosiphilum]|uniref:Nickel/cobalt efflux system n=1 Tax=Stenotrophobium rhamnosiphilum TaxID=2029166 RepID=A0A2T5MCJ4_9GAMM|nr:nickel/cobalt efflux protein RcnA [Stenotrophobium rhamnosiphilum]PTU30298.1 nickel/cobalt efflux protein RcnA [Stenotrophobium rhamnosiphilum]
MTSFSELLQQGAGNAWLFIPSAILLGALHGLEPGHSKTMMAAFIVAVRGTVAQAVLLGLAATVSHTAVVWAVALLGMHLGGQFNAESTEPYFQLGSAVLIVGIALWMLRRTYRDQQLEKASAGHDHHHDETKIIDTGHGVATLEVFEKDVPPCFRIRFKQHGKAIHSAEPDSITLVTTRQDGTAQTFQFVQRDGFLESADEIPEPHEFTARLTLKHGTHAHDFDVLFEEHAHEHDHGGLDLSTPGYQDAHELAHANDIKRRFANKNITTGQIVMFGLTGGLIPCPASITILLLCLQLKQYSLGIVLVLCFSIGLAMTMVASGTIAALSVRHASRRWSGFGTFARRAPYFSSFVIICVGLYTGYLGWSGLAH